MSGSASVIDSALVNQLANPPAAQPDYWTKQMANMNALQDYNAKQATADAYRQSVDPSTGQVDQAKFNRLIAGGPGAWNAGAAMQAQGQAQGAQAQGSSEQVAGHLAQLKIMSGEMSDLLQSGQPITADQIHARLNSLGQEGILTPTVMNGINADLNSQPPGADLTGWLRNHYATNLQASDALKNVTSQPQTVDQGDRKIVVEGNPNMPGGQRVGTSYQQGQAPPALGTTVDIRHADNTIETVLPDQVDSVLRNKPGSSVVQPGTGGGGAANNPLNMRFVGQPGATNSGGFAAFATPEAGQAATDALFRSYASGGINTLTGLISKWAPPSENDTAGYIARVAKATGLDPNTPIDLTNPAIATKIQQAMAAVEGNKNARVMPPQGPQGGQQAPPAQPQGPPGVQMGGAPPPPPGGSQAPYTGGGIGNALAPGGAANPVVIRGTPIPAGRVVGAIQQGMQTAAATPMPANALMAGPGAPSGGAPAPTSPAMPQSGWGSVVGSYGGGPAAPATPVVAPQPTAQPPAQAVPPQAGRGAGWSAPPGYVEKVKADVGGYVADQAAYPAVMTRAQNMAHAYEALQQLQSATGKGAQGINDLRSWAQTLGIAPPGAIKEQQLMEVINKYTERAMLDAAGGSGTDLARQMQSQANPNTGLSTPANLELLRNDMGKSLQTMAAYRDQKDKTGTGYLGNRADVAEATDPRGFVWNLYSPTEQASINAEVARDKTGTAANKLHKAIGMSQRLNLQIPGLTAQ